MIWLALLIPVFAIAILAWKFSSKMNIVEYILVFVVPIICISIGKYASTYSQTHDTEYWNSYGTSAWHEEEWRERWTETETYTTTDSKGNTQIHTRVVTKRRTNPEKWYVKDNIGDSYSISKARFDQLCELWSNKTFKNMERSKHTSHTITKDGNAYFSNCDKIFDHTIPICKQHTYENRVQCSKSVFNFEEVSVETKNQYKLYDYPEENVFGFNPILGGSNSIAALRLQNYNPLNGSKKQIHMMILVFYSQPLEAAFFQECYWKGGNKNEFILCIGVDGNQVTWTKVISWTEEEELKAKTVREIKAMTELDLVRVVDYMGENVAPRFVRKHFADFNYLSVQPTNKAIIITFLITFLTTLGISVITVTNRYDFNSRKG